MIDGFCVRYFRRWLEPLSSGLDAGQPVTEIYIDVL
jgi:hypothetical protein